MQHNPNANREGQRKRRKIFGMVALGLVVAILLPLTIGLAAYNQGDSPSADSASAKTSSKGSSTVPAVDVTPNWPVGTDNLECSVNNAPSSSRRVQTSVSFAWYKNGVLQTDLAGNSVDASYTAKGESWKCVVTTKVVRSGRTTTTSNSDEVTIYNTPPTAPAVDVTPDLPLVADSLVASIVSPSSDADDDNVAYTHAWYKNGLLQPQFTGSTVDASHTAKGQTWKCLVTASDGTDTSAGFDQVAVQNNPPTTPIIDVTPNQPDNGDNLVSSIVVPSTDADGDTIAYTYAWYKNNALQAQLTTNIVDAGYTARGESWKCVVTASDGAGISAGSFDEVTISSGNNPPSAPAVAISPILPTTTDSLVCSIVTPSSDADGDPLTYAYAWYKGDVLQAELTTNTVDAGYTTRGESWKCVVTVTDGAGGSAGSFDEVNVHNSTPTAPVVDVTPDLPVTADSLACSVKVASTDSDGDAITYTYAWYKNSVLQTALTGNTVNASYTTRGETWKCILTASDGAGGSSTAFDEVTIHNTPPTAPAVDVTPNEPAATDDLVCSITTPSSDGDGDSITYAYAWYKNSVLQAGLTSNTVDDSYTGEGQTWRCVVTASDGSGGNASSYDQVTTASTVPAAKDPGMVSTIWTYGIGWRYLTQPTYRTCFINACQDFGIDTVQFQVDPTVFAKFNEEPAAVASSIQAFNAAGIQVWACWNDGIHNGPTWEGQVDGYTMHQYFDATLKWNKDHPTARFTALAFDLECPDGSTDEQHKTHLEGIYATMQTMRAHTVDGTETIESQNLPVVILAQPRWSNSVIAPAFTQVVSIVDVVQIDHYRWGDPSHSSGIEYSIEIEAGVQAIVDSQARYFTVSMSCDEQPIGVELSDDPYGSRFSLGRALYEAHMAAYDAYFSANHPGYYRGFDTYFDVGGFMLWYLIHGTPTYPVGSRAPGDTISLSYTTRRQQDRLMHRVFGVQIEFRDHAGTITKANRIIDCEEASTTSRTISLTIPASAAAGAAEVRLTTWMVGYQEGNYDYLWYNNFSGYSSQLLALSMDELAAMTVGPNGPLTGKRPTFFILQDLGWQSGLTLT